MFDLYLASPFFNDQQIALCKVIEGLCQDLGIKIFSPRLEGPSLKPGASQEDRQSVASVNARGISQSEFVLAVLDYLLPIEQSLRLVRLAGGDDPLRINPVTGPLNLPDTGTVWEMGYANGLEKPVVGFKLDARGTLNVMLCQHTQGVIVGPVQLREFLEKYKESDIYAASQLLKPWQGSVR